MKLIALVWTKNARWHKNNRIRRKVVRENVVGLYDLKVPGVSA